MGWNEDLARLQESLSKVLIDEVEIKDVIFNNGVADFIVVSDSLANMKLRDSSVLFALAKSRAKVVDELHLLPRFMTKVEYQEHQNSNDFPIHHVNIQSYKSSAEKA